MSDLFPTESEYDNARKRVAAVDTLKRNMCNLFALSCQQAGFTYDADAPDFIRETVDNVLHDSLKPFQRIIEDFESEQGRLDGESVRRDYRAMTELPHG